MEALVVVDDQPSARLHVWQRLMLWAITRAHNVQGLVLEHSNGETRWIWCRVRTQTDADHLEKCLHR